MKGRASKLVAKELTKLAKMKGVRSMEVIEAKTNDFT
jgi:hypothetical protein